MLVLFKGTETKIKEVALPGTFPRQQFNHARLQWFLPDLGNKNPSHVGGENETKDFLCVACNNLLRLLHDERCFLHICFTVFIDVPRNCFATYATTWGGGGGRVVMYVALAPQVLCCATDLLRLAMC